MKNFLIIVFGLLLSTSVFGLSIRLQCQTTTKTICASGYRYVATGANNFFTFQCTAIDKTCDIKYDNIVTVTNCTVDYKNNPCTSNTCFYAPSINTCTSDFGGCPSLNSYSYACRDCQTIGNCAKCIYGAKDGDITHQS